MVQRIGSLGPQPGADALADYPIVVPEAVRWGDMDAFGHVNNVQFLRYFEAARVAYFERVGFREGLTIGPILASTSCRFKRPLTYPDSLRVGVRTVDIQQDRFTHEYILFSDQLGTVAASGEGLVVSYDYENGHKAPIPEEVVGRMRLLEG